MTVEIDLDKLVNQRKLRGFMNGNESVLRFARRIYRRTNSRKTLLTYLYAVYDFTNYMDFESADKLLESNVDWVGVLNDYIDYLIYEKKVSRSTINVYVAGVKKWLKVNGVRIDGDIETPQIWRIEKDRIPRREELRKLYQYGDLTDKVLLLLGISTGLRAGTIAKLRVGDIRLDENIPTIVIKPEIAKERPTKGYITFMTPECRDHIIEYLRIREENGEEINDDTPLLSRAGKPIQSEAISQRWERLLKRAALNERSRKWFKLRFHTLRKYFKTYAILSGIPSEVVEAFMGHVSGIRHVYFLAGVDSMENPEVIKILKREYEKAIPYLTINITEDMIRELEEEIEELRNRQSEFETRVEKIYSMINEIIRLIRVRDIG